MKNKYFIAGAMVALGLFSGCSEDFLERPPQDSLVDANFFNNNDQVLASTAALYNRVWFDYNDQASFNLGDFRGGTAYSSYNNRDNVEFRTTGGTSTNASTWSAFFNVIGQSNTVIQNVNRYAGAAVTEDIKQHAIAEARFMRATAYSYLVMNYGAVPIIENNQTLLTDTSITRNTVQSVWEFITRDYEFAAANLPQSPVQEGRVTQWSAEGMLARTYLTRAGVEATGTTRKQEFLDKAKEYAKRVIDMSGKDLMPNYADLFLFPYDNNQESLFELQWVYAPGSYGVQNSMPAQVAYNPIIANGDGWGNDKAATWWMLSLYEGLMENGFTTDQRLHATFMLPGASYPEITIKTPTNERQPFVKPMEGTDVNWAHIKKYITGRSVDVGGQSASQNYGHNTYMLRLAEMYLIYAEAALGNNASTSDQDILNYFNEVHTRSGLPPHITPLTWNDIFEERIIEFAFEGMAWYDLVRLHYYDPNKAYTIISNQDRGYYFIEPNQLPNPTAWTFIKTEWDENRMFTANENNFTLPIPSAELTQAPNLRKAPVPYSF